MPTTFHGRCERCGFEDKWEVPDHEAAFVQRRVGLGEKTCHCRKCGMGAIVCCGQGKPRLTRSLHAEWSREIELTLGPQEEDVILAMSSDLADLIWLLDQPNVLRQKYWTLIAGLCHLLLLSLENLEQASLPTQDRRQQIDVALLIRDALIPRRSLVLETFSSEECEEEDVDCLHSDLRVILPFLREPTGMMS